MVLTLLLGLRQRTRAAPTKHTAWIAPRTTTQIFKRTLGAHPDGQARLNPLAPQDFNQVEIFPHRILIRTGDNGHQQCQGQAFELLAA